MPIKYKVVERGIDELVKQIKKFSVLSEADISISISTQKIKNDTERKSIDECHPPF